MKKICRKCGIEKEEIDFVKWQKHLCLLCYKEYNKEYYIKYKKGHIERARLSKTRVLDRNRRNLLEFLQGKSCIDCGNRDIRVLEFDHRQRETKIRNISDMVKGWSWANILKEIDKCDIRCANCHRVKTVMAQNWFRGLELTS